MRSHSAFSLWAFWGLAASAHSGTAAQPLGQLAMDSWAWGMVLGVALLLMLGHALVWQQTREKPQLLFSLYVLCSVTAAFLAGEWNATLGLPPAADEPAQTPGSGMAWPLLMSALFGMVFIRSRRLKRRSHRMYRAFGWTHALLLLMGAWLDVDGRAAVYFLVLTLGLVLINTGVLLDRVLQGDRPARWLLLAFTIFHLGLIGQYLRDTGFLGAHLLTDHAYQWGTLLHMLVMSAGLMSAHLAWRSAGKPPHARALAGPPVQHQPMNWLHMVVHEVRTPLSVIQACVDNLLASTPPSPTLNERLHKIERQAQKIETVFRNYLESARILSHDMTAHRSRMNLSVLLQRVVQDFKENNANEVALHIEQSVHVVADQALIATALQNLLDNASKYSAAGSLVHIQLLSIAGHAVVRVMDAGIGVEEEDLPHIFENHYRGKNARQQPGMGLGLHLVKLIAEQNGGQILAERNADRGMSFTLRLPLGLSPGRR